MNIPFRLGVVVEKNLAPLAESRSTVGPGRWCLHARSTIPFVSLTNPQMGGREITWGDSFEVPDGQAFRITNTSAHAGDVHLAAMGTGAGAAPRAPSAVTIPAAFVAVGNTYVSRWIDTRTARRVFLCLPGLAQGNITATFEHQAPERGSPYGPGTSALTPPNVGTVVVARLCELYAEMVPAGIGSGQNLDTGGASLPELRPHALLDRARASLVAAEVDPLGFNTAPGPSLINAFYVLEY